MYTETFQTKVYGWEEEIFESYKPQDFSSSSHFWTLGFRKPIHDVVHSEISYDEFGGRQKQVIHSCKTAQCLGEYS